jgi:hypothetical protein
VPSNFTAATVPDLIADMNASNLAGGSNTITLVTGKTFTLTAVDNGADGANGLPVIAAGDNLTILGSGDTVERSTAKGTPAFRLFDVAVGASLQLENMTLQGGLAYAPWVVDGQVASAVSWFGGAIYNQGALTLVGVTVQKNTARGANATESLGGPASAGAGGGLYSAGSLVIEGSTIQDNLAVGGNGTDFGEPTPNSGGNALGGGLCVAFGTATISNSTFFSNLAQGGDGSNGEIKYMKGYGYSGGDGGSGFGGALYASSANVALQNTTVTGNQSKGGAGGQAARLSIEGVILSDGNPGQGIGGGVYVDYSALLGLDAFTLNHTRCNKASTNADDIYGLYDLIP